MGNGPLTREPTPAASLFVNGNNAVKATAIQVFGPTGAVTGAGNLWRMRLENNDSSINYAQFFDLAVGNVTVGTTPPLFSILLPASQVVWLDPNEFPIYFFTKACTIAVTTTRTGSTANTNGAHIMVWYKN